MPDLLSPIASFILCCYYRRE